MPNLYNILKSFKKLKEKEAIELSKSDFIKEWQAREDPSQRERIPAADQTQKTNIASVLGKTTKTKIISNEPHYLLHRGMGYHEFHSSMSRPEKGIIHNSISSWTPDVREAKSFAKQYAENDHLEHNIKHKPHVVSAWVPASKIHNMALPQNSDKGYASEKEVFVAPEHYSKPFENSTIKKSEDLTKGQNGDWQKEGYTTSVHSNPIYDEDGEISGEDPESFIVSAYHPEHGEVGRAKFRIENGSLTLNDSDGKNAVSVHRNHQRKGLASGMYQEAENFSGLKVEPSSWQTEDGKSLWNQPNRSFGKSEIELWAEERINSKPNVWELIKGQQGDWKKEGYKVSIDHDSTWSPKRGVTEFHVVAHTPMGKPAGRYTFLHDGLNLRVSNSNTDSLHQRKGLASEAYHLIEHHTGLKVQPDKRQSPEAEALWSQPNRPFGKSEDLSKGQTGVVSADSMLRSWFDAENGDNFNDWKDEVHSLIGKHLQYQWQITNLPLDKVRAHYSEHDDDTANDYSKSNLDTSPPIVVIPHENGYKTVDGVHRLAAHHIAGRSHIKAWIPVLTHEEKSDQVPGGKGDNKTDKDFNTKQITMGHKVEKEHTKSPKIAAEITRDHLSENPNYYSKLKDSGLADELEKGQNGDWQKEGYTLKHTAIPGDPDVHKILAFSPTGEPAGQYIFEHDAKTNSIFPDTVGTYPNHRRKGLANSAYSLIQQKTGGKFYPDTEDQTEDGKALWSQPNRPFGKSANLDKENDQLYSHADVVSSAQKYGNPHIMNGSFFANKYNNNQQFKVINLPLSHLFHGEKETPSKPLSSKEEEGWAQHFSKEHNSNTTHGPIIAHPEADGRFEIVDGRHRSRAAFLRGETHIRAFVPVDNTELSQNNDNLNKSDGMHVSVIGVVHDGKILLGKRSDNQKWTNPGGHLNPGEDPLKGAFRELFEEAGIKPKELNYLGTELVTTPKGSKKIIHAFVCHGDYKPNSKNDPDQEVKKWEWIDFKDGLPDHVLNNLHSPKNVLFDKLGIKPKEELHKGAMRRLAPFNPKTVSIDDRYPVEDWTGGYGKMDREAVPEMPAEARKRALHKLSGQTQTRVNAQGEREFLLHRGMGPKEFNSVFGDNGRVNHNQASSWSHDKQLAGELASEYTAGQYHGPSSKSKQTGAAVSAWINEKHIRHIPNSIGSLADDFDVSNLKHLSRENPTRHHRYAEGEVIVNSGHNSEIHTASGAELADQTRFKTPGYENTKEDLSNVNARLNDRATIASTPQLPEDFKSALKQNLLAGRDYRKPALQKGPGRIAPKSLEPKLTRPDQEVKQLSGVGPTGPSNTSVKIYAKKDSDTYGHSDAQQPLTNKNDFSKEHGQYLPAKDSDHPQAFAWAGEHSTNEHEGHHALVDKLVETHGLEKIHGMYNNLLSKIHPAIHQLVSQIVDTNPIYQQMKTHRNPRYNLAYLEEKVNMIRDFVHSKQRRSQFTSALKNKDFTDAWGFKDGHHMDREMKNAWKTIRDAANNTKPEDL